MAPATRSVFGAETALDRKKLCVSFVLVQENSILARFLRLSFDRRIRRIEAHPDLPIRDAATDREVVFHCDGGEADRLRVPGRRFAEEWLEMGVYLAGAGWPGAFDVR